MRSDITQRSISAAPEGPGPRSRYGNTAAAVQAVETTNSRNAISHPLVSMTMRIALVLSAHATGLLGACGTGAPGADADPGTSATAAATGEGLKTMPVRSDTIAGAAGEEAAADARNDGSDDSQCGADRLGCWLNLLPTEPVKAEIAAAVGERPIRYYTQGDPVTMDFSPARLNVELGEDGRIELFRCG